MGSLAPMPLGGLMAAYQASHFTEVRFQYVITTLCLKVYLPFCVSSALVLRFCQYLLCTFRRLCSGFLAIRPFLDVSTESVVRSDERRLCVGMRQGAEDQRIFVSVTKDGDTGQRWTEPTRLPVKARGAQVRFWARIPRKFNSCSASCADSVKVVLARPFFLISGLEVVPLILMG
jgi:hypothetical protein